MKRLWAFTLVEVLIAVVLIGVLLIGALTLTAPYAADLQWDRLFDRLEQRMLDTNTYALAGVSMAKAVDEEAGVESIPEMYHLFFQKGEAGELWYLESRPTLPGDAALPGHNRFVTFQQKVDLDIPVLALEQILLVDEIQKTTGRSSDSVLLTWQNPFAQLSFRFDHSLSVAGGALTDTFRLDEQDEECALFPKTCFLSLSYERPESEERYKMVFDLQKGIYRDFY